VQRSDLRALVERSQGGPGARFVLVTIALHANEAGVAFPSVKRLSELTGISESRVRRHLRRLEALGELGTKPSDGRHCNEYQIRLTSEPSGQAEPDPGDRVQPDRGDRDGSRANPVVATGQPGHLRSSTRSFRPANPVVATAEDLKEKKKKGTEKIRPGPRPRHTANGGVQGTEKRRGKTAVPEAWAASQPDRPLIEWAARELAMPEPAARHWTAEFFDYARSKGVRYTDWLAALRNSLRRQVGKSVPRGAAAEPAKRRGPWAREIP